MLDLGDWAAEKFKVEARGLDLNPENELDGSEASSDESD